MRKNWNSLLINSLLLVLWGWLYWPLFDYFARIFTTADFRTNQIILLAIIGLVIIQIRQGKLPIQLTAPPQLLWWPLSLVLGGSLLYLVAERYLAFNTLSASIFFLATYGLLGLWMEPVRWRQGLPVGLLMVGALPFGDHMQTFVGYPLRIATAEMVGAGFQAMGVSSIGVDTILTFENGIAQVDLPCSGVKSLWTGGIFLIAATWIQQQSINLRWLLIGLILGILLICANFMRVAILISVGIVGEMELLAEIIHVPMGVLGFGTACGIALYLLRREGGARQNASPLNSLPRSQRPAWLAPVLIISVATLAIFYVQRPQTGLTETALSFHFPADMLTEEEPLTEQELLWLTKDGAESAQRHRFQWGDTSGSMLLITSRTWRAHHRPERCFEVKGLSVDNIQTHFVMDSVPIRLLSLGAGTERNSHAAVYWFQSANGITDDYATRVWADLALQRERWILVSILFDSDHNALAPDDAELNEFYETMVAVTQSGLN